MKTILLSALAGAVLGYLIVNGVRRFMHRTCYQALPTGGGGPARVGAAFGGGMRPSRELRPAEQPTNSRD